MVRERSEREAMRCADMGKRSLIRGDSMRLWHPRVQGLEEKRGLWACCRRANERETLGRMWGRRQQATAQVLSSPFPLTGEITGDYLSRGKMI